MRHPSLWLLLTEVVLLIFWVGVEGAEGGVVGLPRISLLRLLIQQQAGIIPLWAVCLDFLFILMLVLV